MKQFIKDNNILLGPGTRNSSVTVLVGYAQHLGMAREDLIIELEKEIENDDFIGYEIDRLWDYCKTRGYKDFWSTSKAKKQYKF